MNPRDLSLNRIHALVVKEFIQILRDKSTFGMIFMMPIMQLLLYGYAINTNPKMLPTAFVSADRSTYVNAISSALQNTGYFRIAAQPETIAEAEDMMAKGKVQFIVEVPPDFSRRLLREENPSILIVADGTDPVAIGNAMASLGRVNQDALTRDLSNAPEKLKPRAPPFSFRTHNRYNPEGLTSYNIVPGLIALLLNMTLISMTAVAMTRERERGTLENLLAMPARPIEVMIGKIAPFIIIAYLQTFVILFTAWLLFGLPILGNTLLLAAALSIFIAANLAIGFTISTFARNQLQAMQMTMFYFLPSLLLSGFMFPFRGMPAWAQALGDVFPITHALRIIRGIVLKGIGPGDIWPDIWPMILFLAAISFVAMRRYRETLD
ncbi:MAG: ABC transporter permease [Bdellovibrionales bacterium]